MAGLTIGKFAAAEGVGVETVRFYQRRGLLALPEPRASGYREYTEADRWRLAFIRRARRLGFTACNGGR
jgi:MerR family transcriptional regulator, mercuric resistance operon regulatory protein